LFEKFVFLVKPLVFSFFQHFVSDDDDEEEGDEGEEKMPSCGDYIMHFLTLPWKLIFAFIPPTAIYDGYPTFVISIFFIGACTAVIGDVAGHLGCFIYLKDCVNAIAFVALGTSVPGTAFENTIKCSFSFSKLYKSVPFQHVWFGFISCTYFHYQCSKLTAGRREKSV
jgi:hypothetical protein